MKYAILILISFLLVSNGFSQNKIVDSDGDTSVDTESASDGDTIVFTLEGQRQFIMEGPRLNVINSGRSIFIGHHAGRLDDLSDNQNVVLGHSAMFTNTSGEQNTAIGEAAMLSNSTGNRNTAIGQSALRQNSTGSDNVAIGEEALYFSAGSSNVAIGQEAGERSSSGGVYIGNQAGQLETGSNKLYIANSNTSTPLIHGDFAANTLTINGEVTVTSGIKVGSSTGIAEGTIQYIDGDFEGRSTSGWVSLTSGGNGATLADADNDTKIEVESTIDEDKIRFSLGGSELFRMDGQRLLFLNDDRCIFIGNGAGDGHNNEDNQNTAIGQDAMSGNILSGIQNLAIGESALLNIRSGNRNTVLGQSAMRDLTSGSYNTAVGEDALYRITVDSSNTAIGREAGRNASGSGSVYIGYQAGYDASGSNKLYIDNSDTNSPLIYGEFDNDKIVINGTYEVSSDIRLKSEIEKIENALPNVLRLNGYRYKRNSVADKSKKEIGVIAQEVMEVFPDVVGENPEGFLSVNYSALIPVLIEAIKEQQTKILQLENRISSMEEE